MNRMTATVLANFGIAGALVFAGAVEAEGNHGKVTICHATSSETNPWQELTIGYQAVYGPAGHFSEPGSPNAGHEEDYEGPCQTTTTSTTTPDDTTTSSTSEPSTSLDTTSTTSTTVTDGSSTSSIVPSTSTTETTTPVVPTTRVDPPDALNPQSAPVPTGVLPETGGSVMPFAIAGAIMVGIGALIRWLTTRDN